MQGIWDVATFIPVAYGTGMDAGFAPNSLYSRVQFPVVDAQRPGDCPQYCVLNTGSADARKFLVILSRGHEFLS
jgi:hypothetical protein